MPKSQISAGQKKKRERMKSRNPRGSKKGGFKPKSNTKIIERMTNWVLFYHLKFHHLKESKKRCKSNKCPFRFKVFENAGKIPFIHLDK